MVKISEINTERFILRRISHNDDVSVFNILNDEETIKYLNIQKVKSVSDVDEIITDYLSQYEKGNKFPFAIVNKEYNECIGVFLIKLDIYDVDCFEFTVYIKREFWNKGVYSEVLPYMVDFAFNEIGTKYLRGFVMISNKASATVLKKCGFVLEKTFKVDKLSEIIESYILTNPSILEECI